MVAITNFLLFATTVCATVLPRQASVINADLNAINKNVTALHDSVNAYNGDLSAAITIQQNTNDLQSGIQAATKRVNSSPDIGPKGSKSIVAYISNTLSPNIGDTLNALVGKESTFSSAGLSSLVENDLKSLQNTTDVYGSALLAKADSSSRSDGKTALAKIDSDFKTAIAAFN